MGQEFAMVASEQASWVSTELGNEEFVGHGNGCKPLEIEHGSSQRCGNLLDVAKEINGRPATAFI